jgi:hypothetical protein
VCSQHQLDLRVKRKGIITLFIRHFHLFTGITLAEFPSMPNLGYVHAFVAQAAARIDGWLSVACFCVSRRRQMARGSIQVRSTATPASASFRSRVPILSRWSLSSPSLVVSYFS